MRSTESSPPLALGLEARRGEGRVWRTGLKPQELTGAGGGSWPTHQMDWDGPLFCWGRGVGGLLERKGREPPTQGGAGLCGRCLGLESNDELPLA